MSFGLINIIKIKTMKKLLKKVWGWIEGIFSSIEKTVEKSFIPVATNIVEGIKNAIESDQISMINAIIKFAIPGDIDNKIIDKALKITRKHIPKIALQLQLINSITKIEDTNEQMIAVVNVLKNASKEEQSKYWHELAKQILYALADGKVTWGESASIVEYHYKNYIKKQ